jgi:hypothetical protein
MMNLKLRTLIIIGVIFGAIFSTSTLAVFAELALPGGYVRYVALALFAAAAVIGGGGLMWFLRTALIEWERHDEQTRDIILTDRQELMYVRSKDKIRPFKELGEHQMRLVVVPALRRNAIPLEDAQLDAALYHRLSHGGGSNEHVHQN